jgi:hypothetical protein
MPRPNGYKPLERAAPKRLPLEIPPLPGHVIRLPGW